MEYIIIDGMVYLKQPWNQRAIEQAHEDQVDKDNDDAE